VENTAPPTTETPTTTVETPPTSQAPTTQPPATTSPAPTAPTDDLEQAKQEVIAAAERTWSLFEEATYDPTDDEKFRAAQAAMTGDALATTTQIIEGYREHGRRAVRSDVAPAFISIDPNSVQLGEDGHSATVEFCRLGSDVLVQTSGNPDGSDRVIDDTINAYLERESYVLVNGAWLNSDASVLEKYEGSITCADVG
jgi:hypothetical protein